MALVFPSRDVETGHITYAIFSRYYINDAAVMEARNPSNPRWAADGYLIVTPGNETDFGTIEADIPDLCKRCNVQSVAYDPWAATQLAQRLTAEHVPVFEFRANIQDFSKPTKELDAAMRTGRIEHDGNPVLEWSISNVAGRYDVRSNVYPRKARPEQKIDAAIAVIMATARSITERPFVSVYETRGLDVF
jgi:phage terminase large subunit-like protein